MNGPSFGTAKTTGLDYFLVSDYGVGTEIGVLMVSTARDPNSPNSTSVLRAGLVLGKVTASSKYKQYDNAAADGSEVAAGFLRHSIDLRDAAGTQQDTPAVMITVCEVSTAKIPASGANYTGLDANAITDLAGKTIVRT